MSRMIFPNLPVTDLARAIGFFTELGFGFNEQFTDDKAASMIINDQCNVMLLRRDYFAEFMPEREVAQPGAPVSSCIAITAESREAVDTLCDRAIQAGATAAGSVIDHGFMYERLFTDLDGHVWAVFYMDPSQTDES